MKRHLAPSGYVPSSEMGVGYLQKRFAKIKRDQFLRDWDEAISENETRQVVRQIPKARKG